MATDASKSKQAHDRSRSIVGFHSPFGEYNCFLNAVVQSLWHLRSFRDEFDSFPPHAHKSETSSCALCSLYRIFQEYRYSDAPKLSSFDLRQALGEAFKDQQKFQPGLMDDAGECFIELVQLIQDLLPAPEDKRRLVSDKFQLSITEKSKCTQCGESCEFDNSESTTALAYVTKIIEARQALKEVVNVDGDSYTFYKPFDTLLNAVDSSDTKKCEKCESLTRVAKQLNSLPDIYSLSLAWASDRPSSKEINLLLSSVSTEIDLKNVYSLKKPDLTKGTIYRLCGMILYYGKHYIACFYHPTSKKWVKFDDAYVAPLGTSWHEVHEWCVQRRFQPNVLFYERQIDGQEYYEANDTDFKVRDGSIKRKELPKPVNLGNFLNEQDFIQCPRLQGQIRRKSKKKEWVAFWAKLEEWKLLLFKEPQMMYLPHERRWVRAKRDLPIEVHPVENMVSVELDLESHNYSKARAYFILKTKDDLGNTYLHNIFTGQEQACVTWISALQNAIDQWSKTTDTAPPKDFIAKQDRRASSMIIEDNLELLSAVEQSVRETSLSYRKDHTSPRGVQSPPTKSQKDSKNTSTSPRAEEPSALVDAPDASPEDLIMIAELERQDALLAKKRAENMTSSRAETTDAPKQQTPTFTQQPNMSTNPFLPQFMPQYESTAINADIPLTPQSFQPPYPNQNYASPIGNGRDQYPVYNIQGGNNQESKNPFL